MRLRSALFNRWVNDRIVLRRLRRSGRYSAGRHTYGVPRLLTYAHDDTSVQIGSFTSIGSDVTFVLGGNHPADRITTYPLRIRFGLVGSGKDGYPYTKGDIRVGSDVWIGHGATVLSGVEIGDGAVVAAGSVVVRDVPPYGIVAGSPARLVRHRFDGDTVEKLRRIAWWEWDDSRIIASVDQLTSKDVGTFVARMA